MTPARSHTTPLPLVVGIIGVKGKYGTWLKNHFEKLNYHVIGSDLDTELTNQKVVEHANIVIFSVPIATTPKIISELVEFSKKDQLWLDVTSVKTPAIDAMLKSQAEVVGLHPMCMPIPDKYDLKGKNLVVCRARIHNWLPWFEVWLEKTKATIKESTPEEHDTYTALVQALVHALTVTFAATLAKTKADPEKLLDFSSPTYQAMFALTGRVLNQNPELYADIQINNPHVPTTLEAASNTLDYLHKIVAAGHKDEFVRIFNQAREHLGSNSLEQALVLFEHFNKG